MLGLLATLYAPITSNYNISHKQYLCLGLFFNLADILIPVYARSIILGMFDPFFPREISSNWVHWMIVERNELDLNLICFELPQKLETRSLQRHTLRC